MRFFLTHLWHRLLYRAWDAGTYDARGQLTGAQLADLPELKVYGAVAKPTKPWPRCTNRTPEGQVCGTVFSPRKGLDGKDANVCLKCERGDDPVLGRLIWKGSEPEKRAEEETKQRVEQPQMANVLAIRRKQ